MKLTELELVEVSGGAIRYGILATIGAALVFLAGVVDGFIRPLKCN